MPRVEEQVDGLRVDVAKNDSLLTQRVEPFLVLLSRDPRLNTSLYCIFRLNTTIFYHFILRLLILVAFLFFFLFLFFLFFFFLLLFFLFSGLRLVNILENYTCTNCYWLTLFAKVYSNKIRQLVYNYKLQCAGQQGVKLTNSWPRDKYKLKLQIKQYKLKIGLYTNHKLLNSKVFTKINVTEWPSKACSLLFTNYC